MDLAARTGGDAGVGGGGPAALLVLLLPALLLAATTQAWWAISCWLQSPSPVLRRDVAFALIRMAVASAASAGVAALGAPHPTAAWKIPNCEALLLAALAAALPLSRRHHLWAQLLVLRTLYWRISEAAGLHASQPGGPGECEAFVAAARSGVTMLVPGSVPDTLEIPPAAVACWMYHVWSAAMLGYALPAAVCAALEQHVEWRQLHAAGQRRAASPPPPSRQSTPQPGSPASGSAEQQRSGPAGQQRSGAASPALSTGSGGSSSSTGTTSSSQESLLDDDEPDSALVARLREAHAFSCALMQSLLMLLPLGGALWAALDLVAARGLAAALM